MTRVATPIARERTARSARDGIRVSRHDPGADAQPEADDGSAERARERVNLNSRNLSKPPSSDGQGMPPRTRPKSGKHADGQPGHKGSHREMLAEDQVKSGRVPAARTMR